MHFSLKGITFILSELDLPREILVVLGVLGDQSTLLEQVGVLGKALLISKVLHLGHEFVLGNAGKRVLDLCLEVGR